MNKIVAVLTILVTLATTPANAWYRGGYYGGWGGYGAAVDIGAAVGILGGLAASGAYGGYYPYGGYYGPRPYYNPGYCYPRPVYDAWGRTVGFGGC